ncbi:DUF7261 family protein [Haladaptatus caseinilyticus]|uniref:DUF7261 family protein n=1 Tax=Haladaptatus caseinilyticus TaxID=2993314 RepID=UPI00224AFF56|nr:hypothetical protein [Haladaptatus caseinilyticus]
MSVRIRGTDRGQLILVTGLAIAAILVALVLLLNTVIYTENLATRGADVGGHDVVEFRNLATDGVGAVVVHENQANHSSPGAVTTNATDGIRRYADLSERYYLERASVVEVSNLTVSTGMALRHRNGTRTFTSKSGAKNWTLATNIGEGQLRRFQFELAREPLASSPSQSFRIVLDDGDDAWRAFVYRQAGDIVVATNTDAGGSPTPVCSATTAKTTFSLTDETFAEEPCPIDFAGGLDDPYSVEYRYGNEANGTYSVVVNTSAGAGVTATNFVTDGSNSSPYTSHAVYSATFDSYFRTPKLTYAERIRVAPGEHDD